MSFIRGTEYANKLNSWHNNLEEDRQQRASLRRCSSLLCLMYLKMIPPSHLPNGWLRRMAEHP